MLQKLLIIVYFLLTAFVFQKVEAKEINPETAKKAARRWFTNSLPFTKQALQKSTESYSIVESDNYSNGIIQIKDDYNSTTVAYIIELQPKGFIIVAPDDNINPIIGYSENSSFVPIPSPENILLDLIKIDLSNRLKLLKDGYSANQSRNEAQRKWIELSNPLNENSEFKGLQKSTAYTWDISVGPLLSTTWGQSTVGGDNVFNIYTPNQWYSGCVATALSQILKYYNWPPTGSGSHAYVENNAGTLSTNFGSTTYQWNQMLNSYSNGSTLTQKEAVGLLSYHTGVALDMDYAQDGSSTYTSMVPIALIDYFRTTGTYLENLAGSFYDRISSNINANRPALLGIRTASDAGHAVVVDGVRYNTGDVKYHHLNFGWTGSSDAWYNLQENISAGGDIYSIVNGAVVDIVPSPMVIDPGDVNATGNYTVSWNVSSNLNANYYEVAEGIQESSPTTFSDGAENGTGNWTIENSWVATSRQYQSGSKAFRGYVSSELLDNNYHYQSSITLNHGFYITNTTSITYHWKTYYFNSTNAFLQISTDGIVWNTVKTYTQSNSSWGLENTINLNNYINQMIFIRFVVDYITGSYYDGSQVNNSDVGFFFDDFTITNSNKIIWSTVDNHASTTSKSIAGKSAGVYYYKARAYRDAQWWGWSNAEGMTVTNTGSSVQLPISLASGWNMISSNVTPSNLSIPEVFKNIVSNVVIVKNGSGQVYWPRYGIDQITNWNIMDGYQIYMSNSVTLTIQGQQVNPSTSMNLVSGWNMIAYLPNVSLSPATALASLGDRIVILKDGEGKVYWPQYGVNQIETMQVGKGYQIYLSSAGTLTYPSSVSKEGFNLVESSDRGQLSPQHFAYVRGTGANATILVKMDNKPVINGTVVEIGDEIGVFTPEGTCAGAGVWNGDDVVISVWGDNGETINTDGFTDEQVYNFKLWDKSIATEKDISVIAESGNLTYSENGITVISYERSTALPENFVLRQNYPNPFNPITRIEYQIKEQSEVTLAIYNTAGQLIRVLVQSAQPAGVYGVEWDGKNSSGVQVPSSIYLYRLQAGGIVETRKMVMMK